VNVLNTLLSRSAIIMCGRLGGATIMFACQALIARRFGSESLGVYVQAFAVINVMSALLPLGFHTIASFFAADYNTRQQGHLLRRFLRQAYMQTAMAAATALILGLALLNLVLTANTMMAGMWLPMAVLSFGFATTYISGAVLVALKRPVVGMLGDALFRPLSVAMALGFALAMPATSHPVTHIIWVMAVAFCVIATIYWIVTSRTAGAIPTGHDALALEKQRWWKFALPWTIIAIANDFFFDIDVLLLSSTLSYADMAVFGAMTRMFSLAAFGVSAVYAISLPEVFAAYTRQDKQNLHAQVARSNLVASALALCVLAGVLLVGPYVLGLFGAEFVRGSGPLAVLCLTLLARTIFGPTALFLSFHNRPNLSLPAVALGLVALVLANMGLVPPFGLYGAAWAAVLATTVWCMVMWYTALRVTGTDVSLLALLRLSLGPNQATST